MCECIRLSMCVHLWMFIYVHYWLGESLHVYVWVWECVCVMRASSLSKPGIQGAVARYLKTRCWISESHAEDFQAPHYKSSMWQRMVLMLPWREHTFPSLWKLVHLTSGYSANFQLRPISLTLCWQQHRIIIILEYSASARGRTQILRFRGSSYSWPTHSNSLYRWINYFVILGAFPF